MHAVKYEDTVWGVLIIANTEPFLNPVMYLLLLPFYIKEN